MLEYTIEKRLIKEVENLGGKCLKWVSPGFSGIPDRIVLLPNSVIIFVELKAPGKEPRPLQILRHKQLRNLGFRVEVIDSLEGIKNFISSL